MANELHRHSELESCDGASYLVSLDDGLPEIPHVEAYIRIIKDKSCLRTMISKMHTLSKRCFEQMEDVDTLLGAGADIFGKLAVGRNHRVEEAPSVPAWPEQLHDDALHGVSGDLVRAIGPHSEADPAALLLQVLVGFGNMAGRGPYLAVEGDRHHTNEYAVLVGISSIARKGTSWGRVRGALEAIDQHWVENCLLSGLGSGEALIESLNDTDKRRLIL